MLPLLYVRNRLYYQDNDKNVSENREDCKWNLAINILAEFLITDMRF